MALAHVIHSRYGSRRQGLLADAVAVPAIVTAMSGCYARLVTFVTCSMLYGEDVARGRGVELLQLYCLWHHYVRASRA